MNVALIAVCILAVADAITTERALARGHRERNEFLRRLLGARPSLAWAFGWRAAAIFALWSVGNLWGQQTLAPLPNLAWWLIAALQFMVVAYTVAREER